MLWQHNHERKRFPVALLKKHIWKMWWTKFPSFKQEKKFPLQGGKFCVRNIVS